MNRVLGIDLGGAKQHTTGYVALSGKRRPRVEAAGLLPRSKSPAKAEQLLIELIEKWNPSLVAIDAPLTLPPCLSCPSYCQGPHPDRCELQSAREIWARDGNPATERLCELMLRREVGGGRPLPTMRLGQIAGRGVAISRQLTALRARRVPISGPEVIEVYPTASLQRLRHTNVRLKQSRARTNGSRYRRLVIEQLGINTAKLTPEDALLQDHVFDALIAAYTGWLSPDGLEMPSPAHNVAAGWIWLPKPG